MLRLACVNIPEIAVQLLYQSHPEWRGTPVALLNRDKATGRILQINRQAEEGGIQVGMMYGPALGVMKDLNAAALDQRILSEKRREIVHLLQSYSPVVESCPFDPGTFWLDARGLGALFSSFRPWLKKIEESIKGLGFQLVLSGGSSRFASYAACRLERPGKTDPVLFSSLAKELEWRDNLPLHLLPIDRDSKGILHKLKIRNVRAFLDLPFHEVKLRLNEETADCQRFIREEVDFPLQGEDFRQKSCWTHHFEDPESGKSGVLHYCRLLIEQAIHGAKRQWMSVCEIALFFLNPKEDYSEKIIIRPANPGRKLQLFSMLLERRLETIRLQHPVDTIKLEAGFAKVDVPQLELFKEFQKGDYRVLNQAIALIRAEIGYHAVQIAELADENLPDREYHFRNLLEVEDQKNELHPWHGSDRFMLRRVFLVPRPYRPKRKVHQFYSYSGMWWDREYKRDYAFFALSSGTYWAYTEGRDDEWQIFGALD